MSRERPGHIGIHPLAPKIIPMIAPPNNHPPTRIPEPFKSHPAYRLDFEILIRLPKLGNLMPLKFIASDLKVSPDTAKKAIDRLRVNGYRIQATANEHGFAAGLSVVSWDQAQKDGEAYFDTVYATWLCRDVVANKRTRPNANA